jgi:hypothetical protein
MKDDFVTPYTLMKAIAVIENYDVFVVPASCASDDRIHEILHDELKVLHDISKLDLWGDGALIQVRLLLQDPDESSHTLELTTAEHDNDRLTWGQFKRVVRHLSQMFHSGMDSAFELLMHEQDGFERV